VIEFGCCVSSFDKLQSFVLPYVGYRPLHAVCNAPSIAWAYNTILESVPFRMRGLDALILLHDDLEVTDPDADSKFLAAIEDPDIALAGVCGGRGVRSLDWWSYDTVGHQMIDTGLIDFGPRTGDVDSLEGSILVFSPWATRFLRFDESYPGFHGYDEISMLAKQHGKRNVVVDVDTHHHTVAGYKSEASAREWEEADARFRQKWIPW
jgi:hypothetical protein